jgi:flagellar basal body-associated protein FliL
MNLLEKFEHFVNLLLWKLGALLYKLVPSPMKRCYTWVQAKYSLFLNRLQLLPEKFKLVALRLLAYVRNLLSGFNLKKTIEDSLTFAKSKYHVRSEGNFSKLKLVALAPLGLFSQWLQGLTAAQSMLLLGFTAASFLAGINMIFSGQRLANGFEINRTPASVESEKSEFSRPEYYKEQKRHLEFTSLRIPVYIAKVNQLKSVDVDFNVTFSTRESRKIMSKREFQLRDHLLLNLEPSIADFPLKEEGKDILRRKLAIEINHYLKEHDIQGHVVNVEITYILAN